jgi:hypothetical protein
MCFESRLLWKIFGLKKEQVGGGWRRLHNKELHNLYASPNVVRVIKARRIRWAAYVARMGAIINVCKTLVAKPEGKRSHGKFRLGGEDNNRIHLREIGWGDVCGLDSFGSGYGPVTGSCEHGNEPSGSAERWGIS